MFPRLPASIFEPSTPATTVTALSTSTTKAIDNKIEGKGRTNPLLYRRTKGSSLLQTAALTEIRRKKLSMNSNAELNLHKQSASPVVRISKEDAVLAIMKLTPEAWQWKLAPTPYPPRASDIKQDDWATPKRTAQQIWNHRIIELRGYLASMFQNYKNYEALIYRVSEQPVGLLLYSVSPNTIYVGYFVTHPGSEGAGGALIEAVVNISRGLGKQGHVHLMVENRDAFKTYEHFGFRAESNGIAMNLDPENSNGKWAKKPDGQFVLAKYLNKKYVC